VFGRGTRDRDRPDVARAVTASCAIPGVFRPEIIDGVAYIDGGAHSPTNADVLVRRRPDIVLISSPMSYAGARAPLTVDGLLRRWCRGLLEAEAMALRAAGATVVAFQPAAEDISVMGPNAMDASRRAVVARQAYESTLRRLEHGPTRTRLAALPGFRSPLGRIRLA
jgi:NTE family protein